MTDLNFFSIALWEADAPHFFSQAHKAMLRMLENGCNNFDDAEFEEFRCVGERTQQLLPLLSKTAEALQRQLEKNPRLRVADEVIKEYLQVHPDWNTNQRMEWFLKRSLETEGYIRFISARKRFLFALLLAPNELGSIASRLQGQHLDIEAGAYSVRDLKVVLPKLVEELS